MTEFKESLTKTERLILTLEYYERMTPKEIAAALGTSLDAVLEVRAKIAARAGIVPVKEIRQR